MTRAPRRRAGFGLFDLLLVVLLVSLFALIAMPHAGSAWSS